MDANRTQDESHLESKVRCSNLRDIRSTLKTKHMLKALSGCGWVSMSQLVAKLTDEIAPECAIRNFLHHGREQNTKRHSIDVEIAKGRRVAVSRAMHSLLWNKLAIRKYINREQYYKITPKGMKRHEEYEARSPKPRRRHAATHGS